MKPRVDTSSTDARCRICKEWSVVPGWAKRHHRVTGHETEESTSSHIVWGTHGAGGEAWGMQEPLDMEIPS